MDEPNYFLPPSSRRKRPQLQRRVVNIRDLLEKADKTLYKKRSNDPECPFFQFLPKEKNMRYNLRNTSVSVPRIYTDRFKNVFSNRIIFRYAMYIVYLSLYCNLGYVVLS